MRKEGESPLLHASEWEMQSFVPINDYENVELIRNISASFSDVLIKLLGGITFWKLDCKWHAIELFFHNGLFTLFFILLKLFNSIEFLLNRKLLPNLK